MLKLWKINVFVTIWQVVGASAGWVLSEGNTTYALVGAIAAAAVAIDIFRKNKMEMFYSTSVLFGTIFAAIAVGVSGLTILEDGGWSLVALVFTGSVCVTWLWLAYMLKAYREACVADLDASSWATAFSVFPVVGIPLGGALILWDRLAHRGNENDSPPPILLQ